MLKALYIDYQLKILPKDKGRPVTSMILEWVGGGVENYDYYQVTMTTAA